MKVFFDEDVPRKLARFLTRHKIHTVVSMGCGVKNGALLKLIEEAKPGTVTKIDCGVFIRG